MVDGGRHATAAAAIVGGWAAAFVVIGYAAVAAAGHHRRQNELEDEIQRQVALRNGEHAGRVKAEKVGGRFSR